MGALDFSEAISLALAAKERGKAAVIVTVVDARRNLQARPGNRMVVYEGGTAKGSIEPLLDGLLLSQALKSLEERRSATRSYALEGAHPRDVGVRGGEIDVFFEVMATPPTLVVVGAGHIAVPLVAIAKILDFFVTVIDDRPEYANEERFPLADSILIGPYRETVASLSVDLDTFVVLVTRGHVHDLACLEEVISSPAAYIGMIGSKRRVRTVIDHAREKGFDPAQLQRLHAPIGLDIGAQSPAEIAVAIAAEMIGVLRCRPGMNPRRPEHSDV
jgi:xanthine dehydrogenase accessory factor